MGFVLATHSFVDARGQVGILLSPRKDGFCFWLVRRHWLRRGGKHIEVHSQFISVVDEQMNSFFGDHVCMLICSHRQSDRKGVLSFVEEKY